MTKIQQHLTLDPTIGNLQQCLLPYGITTFEWSIAKDGVENTTVFITTLDHQYVLRVYKQQAYTQAQIDQEIAFIEHFTNTEVPVPRTIPNQANQKRSAVNIADTTWQCLLMQKMPGEHISVFNTANVRELAYYMAIMHRETANFQKFTQPPPEMRETLLDDQALENVANYHYRTLLERAKAYTIAPLNIPHGMIHGDLNRSNALFEFDNLTAILDFEGAHHGYFMEDLAATLWGIIRHIIYKGSSFDTLDTFMSTYQTLRPFAETELVQIPKFLLFRNYILNIADYLASKGEIELQEDLEMESKTIDLYNQWLSDKMKGA